MSIPENLIIRCLFEEPILKPFGPELRRSMQVSIQTNRFASDKFTCADLKREIELQTCISADHFAVCLTPKHKIMSIAPENLIHHQSLKQLQDNVLVWDVLKTHRIWGVTVAKCSNPNHCLPGKGDVVSSKDKLKVIYTLGGKKIAVDLDPKTTVAALKDEIAKLTDIPVNEQRLVYCGSQIGADDEVKFEGSTSLFSLGIRDGDRITVVQRIPIGQMPLTQAASS